MKRRAGAGKKGVKKPLRKALSSRATRGLSATTPANFKARIEALERQLSESLEQQTATGEVLKVISSSPGELQPVFDAMLENAKRICQAKFGNLLLFDGKGFRAGAMKNNPAAYVALFKKGPLVPGPHTGLGRLVRTKQIAHIEDVLTGKAYDERDPLRIATIEILKARSFLAVPMLRDGDLVGAIIIYRQEVRPFTDKQIELVQNFAAQAVIAIENTRLLNELRQRTDDLTESLEQQTATSEVLKVISSSPSDLEPVFQAMLVNATQICEAKFGVLWLYDGHHFQLGAMHGVPSALADNLKKRSPFEPAPGVPLDRLLKTRNIVRTADELAEKSPGVAATLGGARSLVSVPMRKDNELIGAFVIYRQEVRPFTDKQIELVENFATQAVIAIENARVLNELRQRTDDLGEALEQQTATSEVLKVISSSPGELEQVFQAVLENATRICEAKFGILFQSEGDAFTTSAMYNAPPALSEARRREPLFRPAPNTALGRTGLTKQPVRVADMLAEPGYLDPPPGYSKPKIAATADARSVVAVPMLKDNELAGAIVIYRQEVRPFTDKQIGLVQNFAAQAVIAIENTRLLNELRQRTDDLGEALEQQTATSEVLSVISRSKFDLEPILQSVVDTAARLCRAQQAVIFRLDGDVYRFAAGLGISPEYMEIERNTPIAADTGTVVGRAALYGAVARIDDAMTDPLYDKKEDARLAGIHSMIGVPLMREGEPIGAIALARTRIEPFSDREIELVATFADQAVIAIENVRLFDEIQEKSRQLAEASQHKSQFLANMSHELRTPLNAILGYTELIIDGIYGEAPERAQAVLKRVESNGKHLLGLINDVLDLSKIEAGQLKLSLVDYSMRDLIYNVVSAVEPLATKKKLSFKVDLPTDLPSGYGDEKKLTQVLLNLAGNALKFTDAGGVAIKATATNGAFSVAVHDTGPGISPSDQTKLFQQFQQADNSITKTKGGTGLGLAISKKIIELHGGSIAVESAVGRGSIFTFILPVKVEQQASSP